MPHSTSRTLPRSNRLSCSEPAKCLGCENGTGVHTHVEGSDQVEDVGAEKVLTVELQEVQDGQENAL